MCYLFEIKIADPVFMENQPMLQLKEKAQLVQAITDTHSKPLNLQHEASKSQIIKEAIVLDPSRNTIQPTPPLQCSKIRIKRKQVLVHSLPNTNDFADSSIAMDKNECYSSIELPRSSTISSTFQSTMSLPGGTSRYNKR